MGQPYRVAHVVGKMVGGGVEAVVMNYYRHIDRERLQFDFVVDADSTRVPVEEIENLGGRVFEVPAYQQLTKYQKALKDLFSSHRWEVVHSHVNTLSVFPLRVAKNSGIPIRIAHSHATLGKGEAGRNLIKLALRPFANIYPTHRVACSNYAGEWLFGKGRSFSIIPNAIEVEKFRFSAAKRAMARNSWGVSEDCCVVGNLGRMETAKNQSFLIRVFQRFHIDHPNSILVLAGDGSLRDELEREAEALGLCGFVYFLGQVEDASPIYQGMDVFVLPSLYEGFGMALLEAQAASLPCLASDRVSLEAVFSDDCRLLPLELSVDGWADAIWASFTKGERSSVLGDSFSRYDIDEAATELVNYYLRLFESEL